MQFFTKELWASSQSRDADVAPWQTAIAAYRGQLEVLRPRISEEAFFFFREADIHDGELLELVILDGSRPAPLSDSPRPWISPRNHPIHVKLRVLDAIEEFVWALSYTGVRKVCVDFPTDSPFDYHEGQGLGDWGYDELTATDGFLRHEVLFSSGSILLFEFENIEVTRTKARSS